MKYILIVASLVCIFSFSYYNLFDIMFWMYRFGPRWLGFWNGRKIEDICVSIVDNGALDSNFWIRNMEKCRDVIHHDFINTYMSWLVMLTICFIIYVVCMLSYFLFLFGFSKIVMDPYLLQNKIIFRQIQDQDKNLVFEK
jgi:hypothetical protein